MASPLVELRDLQALDQEIRALREKMEEPARRLEDGRSAVIRAVEDVQAKEQEIKENQKDIHSLEVDLQEGEEKLQRHRILLNQAKTNDEYSLLQGQIQNLERRNSKIEEDVIERLTRVEDLQKELADLEKERGAGEASLRDRESQVEREVAQLRERVEERVGKRQELAERIDPGALRQYERILEKRKDGALAPVRENVCEGCFTRVPPQWINLLKINKDLVTCPSCGRILFLADEFSSA